MHADSKDQFAEWKNQYGVNWGPEEDAYRRIIFMKNLAEIEQHNSDASQTYQMGINQFTALTQEEFVSTYLNPLPRTPSENVMVDEEFKPVNGDIDWTAKGKVSPVKNQGQCGSCWAFSAVGVLESFELIRSNQTVSLSEQQLVDCSKSYGNQGCNGGWNYKGLAYVKDHGLTTTVNYPYTAKTGTCKTQGGSFHISSVPTVKGCSDLQNSVMNHPVGVSCDASNWSRYSSGVFSNCKTSLNHDILLVGMSSTYWKIKNSWGSTWGEHGFIRLAPGNTCGICIDKSPWVTA